MFVFKKAETDKQAAKVAGVSAAGKGKLRDGAPDDLETGQTRALTLPTPRDATHLQTYRDVAVTGAIIFTLFAALRVA